MKSVRPDVDVTLTNLCVILHIDISGFRRASVFISPENDLQGNTIREYVVQLLSCLSIIEIISIILIAAWEPLWVINCYYKDSNGGKHIFVNQGTDPILLRSPNADAADEVVYNLVWDERLALSGCKWASEIHHATPDEMHKINDKQSELLNFKETLM